MENVIRVGNNTLIFDGGDNLDWCPENFEKANSWADNANAEKTDDEPKWSFDCGFKLDYDGDLVSISGRFYPPKTHYGPKWDGTVAVFVLGNQVIEEKFEFETLDELKTKVEEFVTQLTTRISNNLLCIHKG